MHFVDFYHAIRQTGLALHPANPEQLEREGGSTALQDYERCQAAMVPGFLEAPCQMGSPADVAGVLLASSVTDKDDNGAGARINPVALLVTGLQVELGCNPVTTALQAQTLSQSLTYLAVQP